jgi:mutator protein MutT
MTPINEKPHFQVTAGIICEEGKVLVAKRPAGSHMEGYWEFPGGKQERGEGLRACLEREMREELGLRVVAGEFLLRVDHEYESRVISLHFFDCLRLEGEPKGLQRQEVRWVDLANLHELVFPPPDRRIIEWLPTRFSCARGKHPKG